MSVPVKLKEQIKTVLRKDARKIVAQFSGVKALDTFTDPSGKEVTSSDPVATESQAAASITSHSDVSGSRSLDTWYQNTSGGPLVVSVTVEDNTGKFANLLFNVNDTQTQRRVQQQVSNDGSAGSPKASVTQTVPDGEYYMVEASPDDTIAYWFEQESS